MRDVPGISEPVKCPSCGKMVIPVINIQDHEQENDYPWAECPECHFNTGNRMDEQDALQFFMQLTPGPMEYIKKQIHAIILCACDEAKAMPMTKTDLIKKDLLTTLYLIHPDMWDKEPVMDYEKTFHDFWKGIVMFPDGAPNVDQIKRELHDAHVFMSEASKVYDYITGGMVSKVTTKAEIVMQLADEHYDEIYKDELQELRKALDEAGPCPEERIDEGKV